MTKNILITTLFVAVGITGCAAIPANQTSNYEELHCEIAYTRLKTEGPLLERDLRSCLHGGFDRRDPKCLDSRRFGAFTSNTEIINACLVSGLLRPSIQETTAAITNLDSIADLAGRLGDMVAAQGL